MNGFDCMRKYLNVLLIGHWLLIGERILMIPKSFSSH